MSTESFESAVKFTAPTNEQTTGSEVANMGASAGEEHPEQQEPKTFTQEDVDRIAARERAAERRRYERELREAREPQRATTPPDPAKFTDAEAYIEALSDFKADQKAANREATKRSTDAESAFEDRVKKVSDKYADFDDIVRTPVEKGGPAISKEMAAVIMESEIGPEIAYYLGSNVDESKRIAGLSPLQQARELGKLEVKLADNPPPVKKTSSAPAPITPLGSRSAAPNYAASDPRSVKMPMSEWAAARNKEKTQRG